MYNSNKILEHKIPKGGQKTMRESGKQKKSPKITYKYKIKV